MFDSEIGEDWVGEKGRTVGRAALALAVVAVVVAGEEGGLDVNRVGDGLAEAVSGERHGGYVWWLGSGGGGGGRK